MKYATYVAALVLTLAMCAPAFAADAQPGRPAPDKPGKSVERSTVITVIHEGSDSIGSRFSTKLKELFNGSNLFTLNEKDVPKMRLILTTQNEFPSRPGIGTVYSLIWTFSQSEGHLGYLLSRDVGAIGMEDVDALAAKIVERTDGIAVKYGYLFQ